jgi:putative hydrolase of the HAD superfamily
MAEVVRRLSESAAAGPGDAATGDAAVGDLAAAAAGMVAGAPFAAAAAAETLAASGPSADDRAAVAVREWQEYRGEVDPDVLALVRQARAAGRPVGLATNATDRLDADLELLGLTREVDAVINSSVVGAPKPAKEYFAAAAQALRLPPDRMLLVDDDDRAVRGARVAGLSAYRWTGPADLGYVKAALGL